MKPVISIVEDNKDFRFALMRIIDDSDDLLLGNVYISGEDAMEMVEKPPDIAIVDIQLPGISGIELIKYLKKQNLATQFLVCSIHDADEKIVAALENGATGYILKESKADQIIAAIHEIIMGGAPMSPYVAKRVISFFQKPKLKEAQALLSDREREVLHLLSKGLQYKEIAERLFISHETVKKHLKHIYQKLHVQNKIEALNKLRLL